MIYFPSFQLSPFPLFFLYKIFEYPYIKLYFSLLTLLIRLLTSFYVVPFIDLFTVFFTSVHCLWFQPLLLLYCITFFFSLTQLIHPSFTPSSFSLLPIVFPIFIFIFLPSLFLPSHIFRYSGYIFTHLFRQLIFCPFLLLPFQLSIFLIPVNHLFL